MKSVRGFLPPVWFSTHSGERRHSQKSQAVRHSESNLQHLGAATLSCSCAQIVSYPRESAARYSCMTIDRVTATDGGTVGMVVRPSNDLVFAKLRSLPKNFFSCSQYVPAGDDTRRHPLERE